MKKHFILKKDYQTVTQMLEDNNTSVISENNSNYKIIVSDKNKEIITLEDTKLIITELLLEKDLFKNQKQDSSAKLNKFKNKL